MLLNTLIIFSLSSAHTIPVETLSKLKELTPQEKHIAEKEKAFKDLKTAAIAAGAAPITYLACYGLMDKHFLGGAAKLAAAFGENKRDFVSAIMVVGIISIAVYSAFKAGQGAKHLLLPDNPTEEKPTKNN